jgi:hypothetical protein
MEVSPNTGTGHSQRVAGKPLVTRPGKAPASDLVSVRNTEAVNGALRQTPDIRSEVVERAREQVADLHYPPLQTIKAFSALLAVKLSRDDGQE